MKNGVWQKSLKDSIINAEELSQYLDLTVEEIGWFASQNDEEYLRFQIPKEYLSLIDPKASREDPIRVQAIPIADEFTSLGCETSDPLAELQYQLTPRLVRRYKSRAVFLATDRCAMYCRHCFRRRFTGKMNGAATKAEIEEAATRIAMIPEIKELLISGGDPLLMTDHQLQQMISIFQDTSPELVIRIGTRIPVVLPSRVTDELLEILYQANRRAPIYIMVQFNHPRELDMASRAALLELSDRGIPLFNQAVLLRGVNDCVEVLEELMNSLVRNRVKPYYLFQGDLASGTSHLRVPLKRGFQIEQELRRRLSGLAMPVYAVDLPHGGGKIPLVGNSLIKVEEDHYLFKNMDGDELWYVDVEDY